MCFEDVLSYLLWLCGCAEFRVLLHLSVFFSDLNATIGKRKKPILQILIWWVLRSKWRFFLSVDAIGDIFCAYKKLLGITKRSVMLLRNK